MDETVLLEPEALRGFAAVARTCTAALVNEPTEKVVDALRSVAEVLGDARFDETLPDQVLQQRYYDRFFVTASPWYLPLCESSVRDAAEEDGRVTYAPVGGARADHVLACYRAVSFDYRRIEGFDLAVKSLRPDSMAAELAFMAFLADAAADGVGDPDSAQRAVQLLEQFAREHAVRWFGKAAECLRRVDDDFYSRVVSLAAEATETITG